jgi:hypothetical protein
VKVSSMSAPPPIITGKYIFSTDSKDEAFAWMEAEETKRKLNRCISCLNAFAEGGGPVVNGDHVYDIETCVRLQKRMLAILEDDE